jgi:hypothetical protein
MAIDVVLDSGAATNHYVYNTITLSYGATDFGRQER